MPRRGLSFFARNDPPHQWKEKASMAETDSGAAVTRPAGEVIGRRQARLDTLRSGLFGDLFGELLGTFALISFGDGVVAMAVAALNQSGRAQNASTIFLASGDWLLITW